MTIHSSFHSCFFLATLATLFAASEIHAESANNAAAVKKCLEVSKEYAAYEAKLREAVNLPAGREAARAALGKLMAAAKTFPHDIGTPAFEAVCAGCLSNGDFQNFAKVRAQLSDPKGLEAAVSVPCPDCGGQPIDPAACSKCGGSGSCPNPKCQGGRQVTQGMAGAEPMVITCMTCQGTMKCPHCKGEGVVGATCPKCRGKGRIVDMDNARDIFRQYMDEAIAVARAKQVVGVEMTGRGPTAAQALKQAIAAAAVKVHGKQKAAQALAHGLDAVVKAYAPVGTPVEGDDGTFSVKVRVCVAKVLPEAEPIAGDDDPAFSGLGDSW